MLGESATSEAIKANTPYGAPNIIRSIIFKMISLKLSKKSLNGLVVVSGKRIIAIPKKSAKNITCNILLLTVAAFTIFSGTISSIKDNGPLDFCVVAWACV